MKHLRYLLLAALVAMPLTACDEDNDTTVTPTIYGTVTGTVTAEGTGISGVSVTLVGATSQSATTGSGGTYTFTNVEAGSYAVTIDASSQTDVSFSQTSKTTTISTDGQTQTVDFAGSYVRTASITGTVSASGDALAGVSVTVSGGPDGTPKSAVTNAGGEFSVTGLRAGTYTVTISNVPAGVTFTALSKSVTVGTGETKSATFAGEAVQLATISGAVTVDNVGTAGITVALSGAATATTETGPNGAFAFTNLTPGSYTVTITAPADVEFTTLTKDITVNAGETGVVNFSGIGPKEPAKISIQSITANIEGSVVPVDLTNVFGQVEVSLNITRGDRELGRVDVLIGDIIVASQTFTAAPAAAQAGEQEVVILSVPTNQVKNGTTMNAAGNPVKIPVIYNGKNFISAILYEVEGEAPIPANEVPVVLNNPDVLLPGDYTFEVDTPDPSVAAGGHSWYTGGADFADYEFLSFSTVEPTSVTFANAGSATCTPTATVSGSYDTGLLIDDSYSCAGSEGTLVPNIAGGPAVVYPAGSMGPDGSTIQAPGAFSRLGAAYNIGSTPDNRWFLVMGSPPTFVFTTMYVDNKAPTVEVDGQSSPVPTLPGVAADKVAFNDDFDQYWVNATYAFLQDVNTWDGGVGVDAASRVTYALPAMVAGPCVSNGTMVTVGGDLDETVVSDGTPDGYELCAQAADLLGNVGTSGLSNFFGVDVVAPMVRLAGTGAGDPLVAPAVPPIGTFGSTTPVSTTPDVTIYSIADDGFVNTQWGPYDVNMVWGLEALDSRSGFHQGAPIAGYPADQTLTATDVTGTTSCATFPSDMPTVLSDNWVRTSAQVAFTCGLKEPAYYAYAGMVTDRAGNATSVTPLNWMIDQAQAATLSSVSFTTTFYNPGQDATFTMFGSDDLEAIEAQLGLNYPVILDLNGDTDLTNDFFRLVRDFTVGTRWDGLPPNFDASLFTTAVTGLQVTIPTVPGRVDFTCAGAGAPYASCAAANALPPTATEYDGEPAGTDAAMLPMSVTGVSITDAGMNPYLGATVSSVFLPAQWQSSTAEPWSTADIITWMASLASSNVVAQHMASTSITEPYFDEVLLVHNDGASPTATITVCGTYPAPVLTDNGVNRFWTYTMAQPAAGSTCGILYAGGGTYHVVGVKGDALLVTQPAL